MATWNNASKADVMLCDEVTLTLSEVEYKEFSGSGIIRGMP